MLRQAKTISFHEDLYFAIRKPVIPTRVWIRARMRESGRFSGLGLASFRSYIVSSMKNVIRNSTTAPYIEPMPYVHRQLALATRNPNANGETKGEMMKPIVQMLSFLACRWNGYKSVTTYNPVIWGHVPKIAVKHLIAVKVLRLGANVHPTRKPRART